MKKWKIATIIGLCTASMAGLGFSTWILGAEPERIDIPVSADDVVVSSTIDLQTIGFETTANSFEAFRYATIIDNPDSTSTEVKEYVGDVYFSVGGTIDTSKELEYRDDLFLKVTFSYVGYVSGVANIIEGLSVYPANYEHYDFPAYRSSVTNQENTLETTVFYFPVQSKHSMSLRALASLDSTYPRGTDYSVPLVFRFSVSNVTDALLDSEQAFPQIRISFGLATSRD